MNFGSSYDMNCIEIDPRKGFAFILSRNIHLANDFKDNFRPVE